MTRFDTITSDKGIKRHKYMRARTEKQRKRVGVVGEKLNGAGPVCPRSGSTLPGKADSKTSM